MGALQPEIASKQGGKGEDLGLRGQKGKPQNARRWAVKPKRDGRGGEAAALRRRKNAKFEVKVGSCGAKENPKTWQKVAMNPKT